MVAVQADFEHACDMYAFGVLTEHFMDSLCELGEITIMTTQQSSLFFITVSLLNTALFGCLCFYIFSGLFIIQYNYRL